jgi:hypothetical protein
MTFVCSQFVAITNACGTNLAKPSMQNRMFLRCNKKYYNEERLAIDAVLGQLENEDED